MISVFEPDINFSDIWYVLKNLYNKNISGTSPVVMEFEETLAIKFKRKYALSVSSGSVALDLMLNLAGVNEDDEIILPSFTIISCLSAVIRVGAKPVFCDVDEKSWNMTLKNVKECVTENTKAIMPIHYGGQTSQMDEINKIAKKFNLLTFEDAAPAAGAKLNNKKAGSIGDAGAFSFFPDKNMTTGEGGMLTTDSDHIAERARIMKKHGAPSRYHHTEIGWNFKMPDPNAALGISQLKRIDSIVDSKNRLAKYYTEKLNEIEGITPPFVNDYNKHTYMLYSILTKNNEHRQKIINELTKNGIETRINFPPMHLQPIYKKLFNFKKGILPITENIAERVLGLPIFVKMTQEQQDQVIKIIQTC